METQPRQAPKREGCKEAILALLEQHGGEMPVKELEDELREMGYTYGTVRKAKEQLKGEQVISFHQFGSHDSKQWKVHVHSHLHGIFLSYIGASGGTRINTGFLAHLYISLSQARGQRLLCCPKRGTYVPPFLE